MIGWVVHTTAGSSLSLSEPYLHSSPLPGQFVLITGFVLPLFQISLPPTRHSAHEKTRGHCRFGVWEVIKLLLVPSLYGSFPSWSCSIIVGSLWRACAPVAFPGGGN